MSEISENSPADQDLKMLASFPILNPNPIVEIDLVSKSLIYANPTSLKLFPAIKNMGIKHPFLRGLDKIVDFPGRESSISREIKVDNKWFIQSIQILPENKSARIYAQDITCFKENELEVERLNKAMIGRELKMAELKQEIARLKKEIAELKKTT